MTTKMQTPPFLMSGGRYEQKREAFYRFLTEAISYQEMDGAIIQRQEKSCLSKGEFSEMYGFTQKDFDNMIDELKMMIENTH